jgi:hypothetical protein
MIDLRYIGELARMALNEENSDTFSVHRYFCTWKKFRREKLFLILFW